MNKIFRHTTLPIVTVIVVACCATAMAGDLGADRKLAFARPSGPSAMLRPHPASIPTNIEQAATQDDPTDVEPVSFEVTFDAPIEPSSFTAGDLVQIGSSTVTWAVSPGVDDAHYTVTATGLTAGTVIPTIPPGVVEDAGGRENQGSISADNSVTFTVGSLPCSTVTYLYAAVWSPPRIYVYCVEANGSLTWQSTVDAPGDVRDMQVSADGLSLYYAHAHLTRFILSTDGSIVEAGSNTVGNGAYDDLVLEPAGQFLYATHSSSGGTVFVYDTAPLATVPPQVQSVSGFYIPHGLAIDSLGQNIYIANWYDLFNPDKIVSFPLLGNGHLDLSSAYVTPFTARAMYFAIHPGSSRLYWTETSGGSVITGSLNGPQVTGIVESDFSGWGARAITIDENGSYVYVANNNTDDVGIFQVQFPGNGGLVRQGMLPTPTARRPEHLILHPGGDYLYVASAGDGGDPSIVSIYEVLGGGGSLSAPTSEVIADQGAYRLAIVDLGP